jgi:hypothetical protein
MYGPTLYWTVFTEITPSGRLLDREVAESSSNDFAVLGSVCLRAVVFVSLVTVFKLRITIELEVAIWRCLCANFSDAGEYLI